MSTQDPHQETEFAPNAPELITRLDSAAEPDPDPDPEPESEPEFDLDTKPRRPPEPDDPPRGTTRNLGGQCPRCHGPMTTRLRAQYGSEDAAKVKLQGYCENLEECGFHAEGFSETFTLVEQQI